MHAHQVLGIELDANLQEITKAYRRLAKISHPDRGGDSDRFIRVRQAYQELLKKNDDTDTKAKVATKTGSEHCGSKQFTAQKSMDDRRTSFRRDTHHTYPSPGVTSQQQAAASHFSAASSRTTRPGRHPGRIFLGTGMKRSPENPSRLPPAGGGPFSAISCTLGCAGIVTMRTFFAGMGFVSLVWMFLAFIVALGVPSGLAVIAGASDRRNARNIYICVVFTLTFVFFCGNIGSVLVTTFGYL